MHLISCFESTILNSKNNSASTCSLEDDGLGMEIVYVDSLCGIFKAWPWKNGAKWEAQIKFVQKEDSFFIDCILVCTPGRPKSWTFGICIHNDCRDVTLFMERIARGKRPKAVFFSSQRGHWLFVAGWTWRRCFLSYFCCHLEDVLVWLLLFFLAFFVPFINNTIHSSNHDDWSRSNYYHC